MSTIERKNLEGLRKGDRLMENIGQFIRAGMPLDEKGITFLKSRKIRMIPTLSLDSSDKENSVGLEDLNNIARKEIYEKGSILLELREELFEKVQPIFRPFSEDDKVFETRGKTRQVAHGDLLKTRLDQLVQSDVENGSQALFPPARISGIQAKLGEIFDRLNSGGYRGPETLVKKKLLPRNSFMSMRALPIFAGHSVDQEGTALAWHAVDTALYFLTALMNINKKRNIMGVPFSQMRFDVDSSYGASTVYRYKDEYLIEAALGAILHPLGYCHLSIYPFLEKGLDPLWDETALGQQADRLRPNINVVRNLFKNRRDISALARMVASAQHEYPDGTGFPFGKEGRIPHEFVRLFQIVDFYDSHTNPYLFPTPYNRQDVVEHLFLASGDFPLDLVEFPTPYRFDRELVEQFFWVLAPYAVGEKVFLCLRDNLEEVHFEGKVHSYYDSPLPLITLEKDLRSGKDFPPETMIWNLTSSQAYLMDGPTIKKRTKAPWLGNYVIQDLSMDSRTLQPYKDHLYGELRNPAWAHQHEESWEG